MVIHMPEESIETRGRRARSRRVNSWALRSPADSKMRQRQKVAAIMSLH
jgi:hypothetical protein